jgi:hypothetical protein
MAILILLRAESIFPSVPQPAPPRFDPSPVPAVSPGHASLFAYLGHLLHALSAEAVERVEEGIPLDVIDRAAGDIGSDQMVAESIKIIRLEDVHAMVQRN